VGEFNLKLLSFVHVLETRRTIFIRKVIVSRNKICA